MSQGVRDYFEEGGGLEYCTFEFSNDAAGVEKFRAKQSFGWTAYKRVSYASHVVVDMARDPSHPNYKKLVELEDRFDKIWDERRDGATFSTAKPRILKSITNKSIVSIVFCVLFMIGFATLIFLWNDAMNLLAANFETFAEFWQGDNVAMLELYGRIVCVGIILILFILFIARLVILIKAITQPNKLNFKHVKIQQGYTKELEEIIAKANKYYRI